MYQMVIKENINSVKDSKRKTYHFLIVTGTFVGLIGGILLMLTGLILATEVFVAKINFHSIEVVFLVLSFIFLGIGTHCLDLMDKKRRTKRRK